MKTFDDVIDKFTTVKAVVVGDVMLDVYEYLLTKESKLLLSEKESKRAYVAQKSIRVLGGAGNVAVTLRSLGAITSLIGISGNDEHYFNLRELSEQINISHCIVRDSSRPTTVKHRLYVDDEYLLRKDTEKSSKIDNETMLVVLRECLKEIHGKDVVVFSDYNKGLFVEILSQEIIKECRRLSIPVVVDFKPANSKIFAGADIVSPNQNEACELYPSFSLENLEEGTKHIYSMLNCSSLVVTLGENGLSGFDGKEYFHIKGMKVHALDAVGCGDTVRAVIALGKTLGLSLKDCVKLANYAAAVIVQKPNTSTVTSKELKEFISKVENQTE